MRSAFADLLLKWYPKHHRRFPWRNKKDPYAILIAEIMLQRTRADQVVPVYLEFLKEFPRLKDLKTASLATIKKYFGRLGLLWRAGKVSEMALDISDRYEERIPSDRVQLLSIPSVGEYVADAVLAFAYGHDVAVVDSNVCRVISRVFGIRPGKEDRRKPIIRDIVQELLPKGKARQFNWAMLDLASAVCVSKNPLCSQCPLNGICCFANKKEIS